jgi:Tfp pilus assembly ATPase PilU
MVTMDQSLSELVKGGKVGHEMALERAANPEDLRDLLGLRRERN